MPICKYSYLTKQAGATREQIEAVAKRLETTPELLLELVHAYDPTPEKKFEAWLVKQVGFQNIRLPEDGRRVEQVLKDFISLSNKRQLSKRDIQQYKKIHDLEAEIDRIKGVEVSEESSDKLKEYLRLPGISILGQNNEWLILEVTEPTSAPALALGTKWCTSDPETAEFYITRNKNLYVVFQKSGTSLDKWAQFTGDFKNFMDLKDIPIREIPLTLYDLVADNLEETQELVRLNMRKLEAYLLKQKRWEGDLTLDFPIQQFPESLAIIKGSLSITKNFRGDLSQLRYLGVERSLYIITEYISTLPEEIEVFRDFEINCGDSRITKIPKILKVGRDTSIMESFASFPEKVDLKGNVNLRYCDDLKLPDNWTVKGFLNLAASKITELPRGLTVAGFLSLEGTDNIRILPKDLKVFGELDIADSKVEYIDIDQLPDSSALILKGSNIRELPRGINCKVLDITGTPLTTLPDDLRVSISLRALQSHLIEIPQGVSLSGNVSLSHSRDFVSLPDNLHCRNLYLDECSNLKTLPKGLVVQEVLDLTNTGVTRLPEDLKMVHVSYGGYMIKGTNPATGKDYRDEYADMVDGPKSEYASSLRKLNVI